MNIYFSILIFFKYYRCFLFDLSKKFFLFLFIKYTYKLKINQRVENFIILGASSRNINDVSILTLIYFELHSIVSQFFSEI
jgi:hypothetical protein